MFSTLWAKYLDVSIRTPEIRTVNDSSGVPLSCIQIGGKVINMIHTDDIYLDIYSSPRC